jgi:hypothetical protein
MQKLSRDRIEHVIQPHVQSIGKAVPLCNGPHRHEKPLIEVEHKHASGTWQSRRREKTE